MTKASSNPIAAMEEILTKSKESSRYFQSFRFMGNPLGYTSIQARISKDTAFLLAQP